MVIGVFAPYVCGQEDKAVFPLRLARRDDAQVGTQDTPGRRTRSTQERRSSEAVARTGIRMRAGTASLWTEDAGARHELTPEAGPGAWSAWRGGATIIARLVTLRNKRLYFIKDSGHPYLILAS